MGANRTLLAIHSLPTKSHIVMGIIVRALAGFSKISAGEIPPNTYVHSLIVFLLIGTPAIEHTFQTLDVSFPVTYLFPNHFGCFAGA